jgi:hypothetical protein
MIARTMHVLVGTVCNLSMFVRNYARLGETVGNCCSSTVFGSLVLFFFLTVFYFA